MFQPEEEGHLLQAKFEELERAGLQGKMGKMENLPQPPDLGGSIDHLSRCLFTSFVFFKDSFSNFCYLSGWLFQSDWEKDGNWRQHLFSTGLEGAFRLGEKPRLLLKGSYILCPQLHGSMEKSSSAAEVFVSSCLWTPAAGQAPHCCIVLQGSENRAINSSLMFPPGNLHLGLGISLSPTL